MFSGHDVPTQIIDGLQYIEMSILTLLPCIIMTRADVWHPTKYNDSLSFREHLQRLPNIPIDTIYQLFDNKRDWIDNNRDWIPLRDDPPVENPLIYVDCIKEEHPPWHHGEYETDSPRKNSHSKPQDLCLLKPILHHKRSTVRLFFRLHIAN